MNVVFKSISLALALSLTLSCGEPSAQVGKPKLYSKDGVTFSYPGNWKVTEDSNQPDFRYIIVETPGDAIFGIHIFPEALAMGLKDYAQWYVDDMSKALPVGRITTSAFAPTRMSGGFEMIKEEFSISLLGETIPHTRHFRRKQTGSEVCYLTSQAASGDYLKASPGFDQIVNSFTYRAP